MKSWLVSLLLAVALGSASRAQPLGDGFDPRARDAAFVDALSGEKGVSATAGRVTVYVPAGAMSSAELHALAADLNRGFDALVAFTHSPRPWQRVPAKLTYYFHEEMFISHADPPNDRLFVAFPRLKNGQAPVLHEATHVLLFPSRAYISGHPEIFNASSSEGSAWLGEGLAAFVGLSAAKRANVSEGDPIGGGNLDTVDSLCAKALRTPVGAELLPFIGAEGEPAALRSRERRLEVAPQFYACATSFTKFLVAKVGIEAVVDSLAELHSEPALEKAAGTNIDGLRSDWRKAIGAP